MADPGQRTVRRIPGYRVGSMFDLEGVHDLCPAIEADIETADIVDDPLIRCLFNDVFGAYQAAQLRRLRCNNT